MASLNVLVVDDDSTNLELAEVILRTLGDRATLVPDGEAALRLCLDEGQRFDLILMDVAMPGIGGLETIRRLRAHPDHCRTPILCVSARAGQGDTRDGWAAGCDHYLVKPYRRQQLIGAIALTLQQREHPAP